ncbi:polysaccharide deacetylase family protein [Paenibacillus rigui]|uniref:Polysaccharide deacetylase n=1 Tax=Paenibacillus rigui TaxID=554312 RepID=A0A229UK40_9BACL|nr:polysaccharide deacetylase family protein [Paenibacillus rigui]OXM83741.1 polysaccharide deacetylase [Paenibacillus rigui]
MKKILMTFPQGKFKVLTMSYDDGKHADRRLVELFNKYGIKGTFHINYGLMGDADPGRIAKEEVAELYRGHEVSAHTLTHPTIARCPKEQLIHEVMEDRKGLEQLVGYTIRGMSYPNGSFNKQIKELLPFLGIEYARVTEGTGGFGMPDDWMEWKPTCHHNHNLLSLGEAFTQLHKSQYLYMMYVWGHSYEFDNDNNWELISRFCEQVGGNNDIWYATNIEIVDYVKAFQQLKFSAAGSFVYNPSARPVWIRVDDEIIEITGGGQVRLEA